jgi:hypothetical protein
MESMQSLIVVKFFVIIFIIEKVITKNVYNLVFWILILLFVIKHAISLKQKTNAEYTTISSLDRPLIIL